MSQTRMLTFTTFSCDTIMTGQTYDVVVTFKDVLGWLDQNQILYVDGSGWPINILLFVRQNIYLVFQINIVYFLKKYILLF